MRRRPRGGATRGFVLIPTFLALGIVGVLLGVYFSLVQLELRSVTMTIARSQALYVAEAGLDAAIDLLALNWDAADDPAAFPLQERVTATINGDEQLLGAFEVAAIPLTPQAVRLISTGRSLPAGSADDGTMRYQVARTLSITLVRKRRPIFSRRGAPGVVAVQAHHFDTDGIPDLLAFSGELDPSQDDRASLSGVLSAGGQAAFESGYHLLASLTDVDDDGDLDLVLSDAPSRDEGSSGAFIPNVPPSSDEVTRLGTSDTSADMFGTGTPVTVTAQGWLFLPEGSLSGSEAGTDVFLNRLVYDAIQVAAWTELSTR